jgi:hypothetical protein
MLPLRPLFLIQIDAPFSSRLSRYSELADHMDLCGPGLLIGNLTGLSVNDRLRITWSIRIPNGEQLTEVLGQPDPMAGYRLLTLTVTRNSDREA